MSSNQEETDINTLYFKSLYPSIMIPDPQQMYQWERSGTRKGLVSALSTVDEINKGMHSKPGNIVKRMLMWYALWPNLLVEERSSRMPIPVVCDGDDGTFEVCLDPDSVARAVLYITDEYVSLVRASTGFEVETTYYVDMPSKDIGRHIASIAIKVFVEDSGEVQIPKRSEGF